MFEPVTHGWGQFWLQGHHMNTIDRGPEGDAQYQMSKLYAFQFQRRKFLKLGLLCFYVLICDPQGGLSFDPRGII